METPVVCQKCLGTLEQDGEKAVCAVCRASFAVRDGVYYFTPVAHSPEIKKNARDQKRWTVWRTKNFEYLKKQLQGVKEGAHILDVGAGEGHFKELYKNLQYTGIDFYPYEDVSVVSDITQRFPFRADAFDCLVLSNVLEHIQEPERMLHECYRVLRPEGKIIILVPFIIKLHQIPYDFLRYTHFMLAYLLKKAGFKDIEIEKIGTIYDVQEVMNSNIFSLYRHNLRKHIPNKYARAVPYIFLKISRTLIFGFFSLLRKMYNDTIDETEGDACPSGYGAVAVK